MKYLFYFSHPSHFYTLNALMQKLIAEGNKIFVFIKTKDILEDLVSETGLIYINISPKQRRNNRLSLVLDVLKRNIKFYLFIKKNRIDRVVSCASDIGQVVKFTNITSFLFNDDDHYIVPYSAKYGWPFATVIFSPVSCNMGLSESKTVKYKGYQKLYYLHPQIFKPSPIKVFRKTENDKYFLIRTVSLQAHHDINVKGLEDDIIIKLIDKLKNKGKIYISSENKLPKKFEKYKLDIPKTDIHHFIYYAEMLIGDSQSMTQEAAILGTPSIRYNDFVGKIGVLEELEHKYKLTFGISPTTPELLFEKIDEILNLENYKHIFNKRKEIMLREMINVNDFAYWFISNYPQSKSEYITNPKIQNNFI